MHPYVIDRMVQERRDELLRLASADRGVREARRVRAGRWPLGRLGGAWAAALATRIRRRAHAPARPAPAPTRVLGPCPEARARP